MHRVSSASLNPRTYRVAFTIFLSITCIIFFSYTQWSRVAQWTSILRVPGRRQEIGGCWKEFRSSLGFNSLPGSIILPDPLLPNPIFDSKVPKDRRLLRDRVPGRFGIQHRHSLQAMENSEPREERIEDQDDPFVALHFAEDVLQPPETSVEALKAEFRAIALREQVKKISNSHLKRRSTRVLRKFPLRNLYYVEGNKH